jgi:GTP-binding protein
MAMPLVAIIGRPNVGKSTLFNRLTGTRIAIVEDTPGVTRDRIYANGEWGRHTFTLIDTGGIEPKASGDVIMTNMRKQAELAIDMADVIVFIVDGQAGVTADDIDVANLLRRSRKPIVLAVNKIDSLKYEDALFEFCTLGIGDPMSISAEQALGLGDLLDEIVKYFPEPEENEEDDETIHIAIVGKPNVGKSSLLNALLGAERSIVSDVPGTTRDAIDTPLEHEGRKYILIDTAGIRRKSRIDDETVERYSVIRSFMAIRRADVALIVIDAVEGITEQDVKIAGYVHEEGKASAIIVNKWDSVNKDTHTVEKYKKEI